MIKEIYENLFKPISKAEAAQRDEALFAAISKFEDAIQHANDANADLDKIVQNFEQVMDSGPGWDWQDMYDELYDEGSVSGMANTLAQKYYKWWNANLK